MAIVKMKRIRLIALAEDRDALLSSLLHVGCVEISEPELPQGEADEPLLHRDKALAAQAKGQLAELSQALAALRKYAPQKGGLLTPRPLVGAAGRPLPCLSFHRYTGRARPPSKTC